MDLKMMGIEIVSFSSENRFDLCDALQDNIARKQILIVFYALALINFRASSRYF